MVERVAVGVNGGAGSAAAIAWVTHRASSVSMEVTLFTVIEQEALPASLPEEWIGPAYERVLADAAETVRRDAPGAPLSQSVRRGPTTREMLLAGSDADLLVIGTREPTGFFSGTLRHQIAAGARCPVVVVPAGWTSVDAPIVVGIENDATSLLALDFAAEEAARLEVPLNVVLAWSLPVVLTAHWLAVGADPFTEIRHTHEVFLAGAVESIKARHPSLEVVPSLEHGPAAVILTEKAEGSALLVVGTHGRGKLPLLFLGSVAHDLLVSMPCPVALVPSP